MSVFDIEKVFWSSPRFVDTRIGRRRVRTWTIPKQSPFWRAWATGTLREQGYTVAKWKGDWVVTEWRLPDGETNGGARSATAAAQQSQRTERALDQAEVELPPDLQQRFEEIIVPIYNRIREETGDDYSYQFPSIRRLAVAVDAYDGGLDASDTGTGKTPVACAVARILDRDLFVICPKNVIPPWKRMAREFGVRITAINYEMLRTGNTEHGYWAQDHGNRKRTAPFRKFVFDVDPHTRLFVFDECHRLKDYRTQNCAMGVAAIDAQYKVLALSATAADNPMHMKFIALLTGLIRHPNHFYGWMTQNGVRKGKFGLEFVGGRQVLSRIHRQIFPLHGSRIRIAELGDRFPQTRIVSEAYAVENPKQINAIYAEMRREIAELEATKQSDPKGWQANVLVAQLRARQEVELIKVPTFKAMAEDAVAEGMNVVVALNYTKSILALARRLRTTNILTGDTETDRRQELIDAFNADDERLIVMNLKLGVGIGLHGTSRGRMRAVYISPTFSAPDLIQMFGRVPRGGGAQSIQYLVWAAGTVEENANRKVRERMHRISIFNDDQLEHSLQI